ncbi:MAG: hypothetical protein QXR48_03240 [Candidatus Woesearchaeota archaeon]
MPRANELELILETIDELARKESLPCCTSCVNNNEEAVVVAFGKDWVARNNPSLAEKAEQSKDLNELLGHLTQKESACLQRDFGDYNPVICQKVNLRYKDAPLYICPHFEADDYYVESDGVFDELQERDRRILVVMRKKYSAELENLLGNPPARRI